LFVVPQYRIIVETMQSYMDCGFRQRRRVSEYESKKEMLEWILTQMKPSEKFEMAQAGDYESLSAVMKATSQKSVLSTLSILDDWSEYQQLISENLKKEDYPMSLWDFNETLSFAVGCPGKGDRYRMRTEENLRAARDSLTGFSNPVMDHEIDEITDEKRNLLRTLGIRVVGQVEVPLVVDPWTGEGNLPYPEVSPVAVETYTYLEEELELVLCTTQYPMEIVKLLRQKQYEIENWSTMITQNCSMGLQWRGYDPIFLLPENAAEARTLTFGQYPIRLFQFSGNEMQEVSDVVRSLPLLCSCSYPGDLNLTVSVHMPSARRGCSWLRTTVVRRFKQTVGGRGQIEMDEFLVEVEIPWGEVPKAALLWFTFHDQGRLISTRYVSTCRRPCVVLFPTDVVSQAGDQVYVGDKKLFSVLPRRIPDSVVERASLLIELALHFGSQNVDGQMAVRWLQRRLDISEGHAMGFFSRETMIRHYGEQIVVMSGLLGREDDGAWNFTDSFFGMWPRIDAEDVEWRLRFLGGKFQSGALWEFLIQHRFVEETSVGYRRIDGPEDMVVFLKKWEFQLDSPELPIEKALYQYVVENSQYQILRKTRMFVHWDEAVAMFYNKTIDHVRSWDTAMNEVPVGGHWDDLD